MPVLGAVLTLSNEVVLRSSALAYLAEDPRIELGEPARGRQPIVLNTTSRAEDKALWRSLETHGGITHLELAFADFSDLQNEEPQS